MTISKPAHGSAGWDTAVNLVIDSINNLATFNVKDFGATGDGIANDTTAVAAALTAASSASGGIVYLPKGTYAVSSCLDIPANTTLAGSGMGVSTIKAVSGLMSNGGTNGGYSVLEQKSGAAGNIMVRDLTVDANHSGVGVVSGSANRQNAGIVDFRALTGLTIQNVEVKDGWFYHLAVWTSTDVLIDGCKVTGPGTTGVYDQLDGIHLVCCTQQTVTNCQVNQGVGTDGDDGIVLHQFPSSGINVVDAIISGNRVRGGAGGAGIDLANADGTIKGVTITGNMIHDCVGSGIITNWFSAFTGTTQDVTIAGNTIRDCGNPIMLGDGSAHNAPYANFVVAGNQVSRSNGQVTQQSTTGATAITIDRMTLPLTTLSYAATLNTDVSLSCRFRVTLTGNVTLAAPTGATIDGQRVTWEFIQDGTGSRTLTLNAAFALGTTIASTTLTTTASKRDYLTAVYDQTALKWYVVEFVKGF